MPLPNLSLAAKNVIVTRFTCFFWLVGKIICYKLWLADRLFPVLPPFNCLFVPSIVHLALFALSLLAIIALLLLPANKVLQTMVFLIELASCLLDQTRWQPWEYQYIFMILALIINYKNDNNRAAAIAFIFASIYFFSGLGKINPAFLNYIWYKIILSHFLHLPHSIEYHWWIFHTGYLLGIVEVLLGIGLLFGRTQKAAAVFLIAMHILILTVFGPFGINYDRIVWPWNIAMIFFLYVFFIRNKPIPISLKSLLHGWNKLIFISFAVLPVLSFFGYWDYFLSSSLFSLRPPEMYICIRNPEKAKELKPYFITDSKMKKYYCDSCAAMIDVRKWGFKEMEVPAYPELRVYKEIKEQLQKRYPEMDATFTAYPYINGKKERMELK